MFKKLLLIVFLFIPAISYSEPTEEEMKEFYLYAYKGAKYACDSFNDMPENIDKTIEFLRREDIGRISAIHSHDGLSAETFKENKKLAAAIWVAGWKTMIPDEKNACFFMESLLTVDPELTEKAIKKMGMLEGISKSNKNEENDSPRPLENKNNPNFCQKGDCRWEFMDKYPEDELKFWMLVAMEARQGYSLKDVFNQWNENKTIVIPDLDKAWIGSYYNLPLMRLDYRKAFYAEMENPNSKTRKRLDPIAKEIKRSFSPAEIKRAADNIASLYYISIRNKIDDYMEEYYIVNLKSHEKEKTNAEKLLNNNWR